MSPLGVHASVAAVHNTVFRNMRLGVELADVSYEGTIHFSNVSLANVTLTQGRVVATTASDYSYESASGDLFYEPEDDVKYDVEVTPVLVMGHLPVFDARCPPV